MGHLGPTWFQGDELAPPGVVFHYTSRVALARILSAGVIRPHKSMVDDRTALVWASTCGTWEPAAGRAGAWSLGQPLGFDVMAARGLARIMLDEAAVPLRWAQLQKLVSPQWLASLQGEAGAWVRQNAHRWRGSTHPVSRDHWCSVEVWRQPMWRALDYSWEQAR